MDLIAPLHAQFGLTGFRAGQEQVITQLLAGHSSIALFATGSGKSLCYQYTALQLPHLTIVVSPLLALITDQLQYLHHKGIAAASIDSSQDKQTLAQTMQRVRRGEIKILMISVERFKNERFRRFIAEVPVSMLVVDEAHCISEWGHNFRPDYLKLPYYKEALNIPLTLLLTATATNQVKRDMAQKFAIKPEHCVQTPFYRSNLSLTVTPCPSDERKGKLVQLCSAIKGATIIYVTLQQTAQEVAHYLTEQGHSAGYYHAGLESSQRQQIQQQFIAGELNIVVATIAFGMGVDKSDIRHVIHYDLPKSIENYTQEIGRAGRDGAPSQCTLLGQTDGVATMENFVVGDTPELSSIHSLLDNIASQTVDNQWEMQIYALSMATNIRQLPLKTLLVQLELMGVIQAMHSYFAQIKYKFIQTQAAILHTFDARRQAFLQQLFTLSIGKKVWFSPDFSALAAANIDRAKVMATLEYLQQQQLIELTTEKVTDVYRVTMPINQENQAQLANNLHHYCQTNEQSQLNRIAQMIRFFELDRCLSYNLSRYFGGTDAPQQCGHCSVCLSGPAKLHQHEPAPVEPSQLDQWLNELQQWCHHNQITYSHTLARNFLLGLTSPRFTQLKAKKLTGFGALSRYRVADVQALLLQRG